MFTRNSLFALGLVAGAVLAFATPATASMYECTDESNLCLQPVKGGKWESGKTSSSTERRKRTKSKGGKISLTVEGGRGSLFLNGRYAGTAPLDGISVPRGVSDIQVRDGASVLASGTLTVPASGKMVITVNGGG